ncbi:MAG: DUF1801 domain-containing protein [Pseudomonadota bacterium]
MGDTLASIHDPQVRKAFEALPKDVRAPCLDLRELILEVAGVTPGVGDIIETLKWGEPSYLPARARVGTTVRINARRGEPGTYQMLVHCQTKLIDQFREVYPDTFRYDGTRAIVLRADTPVPREALSHCVALALTYHRRTKARA